MHDGGGSWDEDDELGGGSTQSPGRSKPKRNKTNIEKPNTSYNPITKSLKSFGEIAKGLWGAADERRKRAFDSPYDFANYMTIGILDATWAGAKARASKRYDSVYDFADWITLGTVETFSGALNPDEAFSAEHWMDSLGAAAIVTGGIKMADKVAPGIVSVKDDIARVYDDLFKKETMGTGKVWKTGDPINTLTKKGNYPSWSTSKSRYWKNVANEAEVGEYTLPNLTRMKKGRAPLHPKINVPKELHHIKGRNILDPHNIKNLKEVWPWEHADIDPFRYYKGPRP